MSFGYPYPKLIPETLLRYFKDSGFSAPQNSRSHFSQTQKLSASQVHSITVTHRIKSLPAGSRRRRLATDGAQITVR